MLCVDSPQSDACKTFPWIQSAVSQLHANNVMIYFNFIIILVTSTQL